MTLLTEATDVPDDEQYHTLVIEELKTGDYSVTAVNNDTTVSLIVGSVAFGGESAGFVSGDCKLDAAGEQISVECVDFTDEYGYREVQVSFGELVSDA